MSDILDPIEAARRGAGMVAYFVRPSAQRVRAASDVLANLRDDMMEEASTSPNPGMMRGWAETIDLLAHALAGERDTLVRACDLTTPGKAVPTGEAA